MAGKWEEGSSPWEVREVGDRIYGRGTADNKGQHTAVMLALEALIAVRGNLGFNSRFLIDTCEETGSPGLREFCRINKDRLRADLFIGSDGPRFSLGTPATYGGARGAIEFDLTCNLRERGLHSGNWGGLAANPAVMIAHAISSLISASGRISVRELVPGGISEPVRRELARVDIAPDPSGPKVDLWWGEPGLSAAERVFAWSAIEVLAFSAGNPENPVNAIPPKAWARCQLRHTVDVPIDVVLPAIRARLVECGIREVEVNAVRASGIAVDCVPTRLDPDHPAVKFVMASIDNTLSVRPVYLPNMGGTICNDCFADILELPTVWVPLSYTGCNQHAPNEHVLKPLIHQGLAMLAGIFWDCGDPDAAPFLHSS
jgi:acetylornithine deacetylase/succinyl-diaminopimelate desuccinylase-like protein